MRHSLSILSLCLLSACSYLKFGHTEGTPDNQPTIKTLAGRSVVIDADQSITSSGKEAIAAYRNFLAISPKTPQRAEAMRRVGDLEMDNADVDSGQGDPDFHAAIASYQAYLKSYPNDPGNDRILYQLARGQEQGGDLPAALATLKRLVSDYPKTTYSDEAQFRLGELLFASGDYPAAEKAYAVVIKSGADGKYYDRALYMQGWSQFKQGQLELAVQSFFGVLDLKLSGAPGEAGLESIPDLTRADRELLEDTFRVVSLSLENLQGAESINAYITTPERKTYEFRVYEQLAELYLKQDRSKDAADTFTMFAHQNPLNRQAPVMLARVIEIDEQNGFATLALQTKKEYVVSYGVNSEFHKTDAEGWDKAAELVKQHQVELARYYHASAQKSKSSEDYDQSIHWYREYLNAFPDDKDAAENNFLLAELLFESGRYADASAEYEKTAYHYPVNPHSADAGYAALLSYAKQVKAADATQQDAIQKSSVASALQFADAYKADPRTPAVLANAAEKLYALKDNPQAAKVAQQILDLQPAAPAEQRRIAWTVIAFTTFEAGTYQESEQAFAQVLLLTAPNADNRNDLIERQAAAIYKQGEQAQKAGELAQAVTAFDRVGNVAPDSPIRATAQYDAAAALVALKEWDRAATMLEDFRRRYPKNALTPEVGNKLAAIYLEQGKSNNAAIELDAIALRTEDNKVSSDMLWQAAELHDKGNDLTAAGKDYERYLAKNTDHTASTLEARYRLANYAKLDGNKPRELALMKEIMQTEQTMGAARNDRSRYLAATAALAIAEPVAEAYRKISLVEPLKKNLALKKSRMEESLKAYAVATDYGVADISTEATFKIASIYRDFGKALITSERPAKLNKAEREQYDVLLEEQAFPFEEKAIEIHEVNAQRTTLGIYDQWVKNSFGALRELKPVRYGKTERIDPVAATDTPGQPATLNRQAVALREQGRFDKAAEAYKAAITADPTYKPAILNLGILYDMYLGDNAHALEMYARYLALKPEGDPEVSKWVKELQGRKPVAAAVVEKDKS